MATTNSGGDVNPIRGAIETVVVTANHQGALRNENRREVMNSRILNDA